MKDSLERFVVSQTGPRLDKFLALRLPHLSRAHLQRLIAGGAAWVNGRPAEADRRLKAGDAVEMEWKPSLWEEPFGSFEDWVMHEDKHILVLDKPAGLLMHPLGVSWLDTPGAALFEREPNLAGLLLKHRPDIARAGTPRCGIVHRLDRFTSGVLLVAKTPAAHEALVRQFKEREIAKTYRAVVRGSWTGRRASVDAPVGRKPGHRRVIATPFGKAASTSFILIESCPKGAWVEAKPLTGRTHQIRAHLQLLGHPVMGDSEFDRSGPQDARAPRLMLHAYRIEFTHPASGRRVSCLARIPRDMREFWARCRKGRDR